MSDEPPTVPTAASASQPARKPPRERMVPISVLNRERKQRWAVYHERNQVVALLARLIPGSHRVRADESSYATGRDEAKRTIIREVVCVHLPDGTNLTWHYSPESANVFAALPYAPSDWDGHTNDEKYRRMADADISAIVRLIVGAPPLTYI